MLKTFDIKIDIEKELYSPMQILFNVSNLDDSVELSFEFTQDGNPFDLTGKTVQLAIQNPSQQVRYQDVEIQNAILGTASAMLSQLAYQENGIHISEIYIKDVDNTIVTSPFYFNAWESIQETVIVDDGTGQPTPTGQPIGISDVVGLQDALDSKADVGTVGGGGVPENHTHEIIDVNGLDFALDSKADINHTHEMIDVNGLDVALDSKADINHTHGILGVLGLQDALDSKVDDAEMGTKADLNHNHGMADVTGLQNALDGKASVIALDSKANVGDSFLKTETYSKGEIYNKTEIDQMTMGDGGGSPVIVEDNLLSTSTTNALSSNQGRILDTTKADLNHVHEISDVAGLQSELGNKSDINHNHDLSYAPINHNHDLSYSPINHNHDDAYAPIIHTHDEYAPINHNHDSSYAPINHNHDLSYAPIIHTHDEYAPTIHVHEIGDVNGLQVVLDGKVDNEDLMSQATWQNGEMARIEDKVDLKADLGHSHTSADITDFGTAVAGAIPTEYMTQSESDAKYQPIGEVPAHTHPEHLTEIPAEYLTESEGDLRFQAIGTVPIHSHTEADITFGGVNAQTYVDNSANFIMNTRMAGLTLWKGTQIQYDALTPNASTLYFIVG